MLNSETGQGNHECQKEVINVNYIKTWSRIEAGCANHTHGEKRKADLKKLSLGALLVNKPDWWFWAMPSSRQVLLVSANVVLLFPLAMKFLGSYTTKTRKNFFHYKSMRKDNNLNIFWFLAPLSAWLFEDDYVQFLFEKVIIFYSTDNCHSRARKLSCNYLLVF